MINRFLVWLVFNIPLGRFAPRVLGLALGSEPVKVSDPKQEADPQMSNKSIKCLDCIYYPYCYHRHNETDERFNCGSFKDIRTFMKLPLRIRDLIDVIISHNEIIAIWETIYDEEKEIWCRNLLWQGMGWDMPGEYSNRFVESVFGTIPENIDKSDTINICVSPENKDDQLEKMIFRVDNYNNIRNMSIDEMASFLTDLNFEYNPKLKKKLKKCKDPMAVKYILAIENKKWLESEAEK